MKVAQTFFPSPTVAAVAYGLNFPDGLSGGAHIGAKGGPLLLVDTNMPVATTVRNYLTTEAGSIAAGYVYGGTTVISDPVMGDVAKAISGVA
jgi:hypothetical protein